MDEPLTQFCNKLRSLFLISWTFLQGSLFCLKSAMNRSSQLKVFDKNRCSTIPVKEFILSKVAGLKPSTLLKNASFRRHFSRVLIIVVEHLFCRTPLNGFSVCRNFSYFCIWFLFNCTITVLLIRDEKLQNALSTWQYLPLLRRWHK